MKTTLLSGYTFTAATKKIDFSAVPGFDLRQLLAVVNLKSGRLIYAVGQPGLGYTAFSSGALTLAFDTTAMADGDALGVFYDRAGGLVKTMTVVTLPAYATGGTVTTTAQDGTTSTATVAVNTAVQLLPANPGRRNFRTVNLDVNRATYGYNVAVSPGKGWPIAAAAASGDQGGGDDDTAPHTGAIYGVSTSGTTLVLIEG